MISFGVLKAVLVLSVVAVALSRRPTYKDLDASYSFEQFAADFDMKWALNTSEWSRRKLLFESELKRVLAHNLKGLPWKEGVNQFSAMTQAEKRAYLGKSRSTKTGLQVKLAKSGQLPAFSTSVQSLPKAIDWRTKTPSVMTPVKNQGSCGSCWAFASTATLESHVALSTGLLYELSVQQTTSCTPNPNSCGGTGGCSGATAELAFDYIANAGGIVQEYSFGYTSGTTGLTGACSLPSFQPVATISGYNLLPSNNYTALMNAVATVGPIAINVDASTFHAYESGVFSGCSTESSDINHVVVLAGYGTDSVTGQKYWLIRNSWSPSYGEGGYIRVARSDSDEENCAVDSRPQDGVACEDAPEPVKVCGTCGVIYDSSYPVGAKLV